MLQWNTYQSQEQQTGIDDWAVKYHDRRRSDGHHQDASCLLHATA
jgi:hypothetical protein